MPQHTWSTQFSEYRQRPTLIYKWPDLLLGEEKTSLATLKGHTGASSYIRMGCWNEHT